MDDARSADIRAFLAMHRPFDLLPAEVLEDVSGSIEIQDVRRGAVVMEPGATVDALHIVRSGAVEIRDPDGQLLAQLGEGECFGVRGLLRGGQAVYRGAAIDDGAIYRLPASLFHQLVRDHPPFAYHFLRSGSGSLDEPADGGLEAKRLDFFTERVGTLISRGPVTISPGASIHEAACTMRDQDVSCLMITEGDRLVGIVTDQDLRSRVVAEQMPYDRPVETVMARDPHRIRTADYAADALFLMLRHDIHHLPVLDGERVVGCLTSTSLIERQSRSPFFLTRAIQECETPEQLRQAIGPLPDLVVQMVSLGNTAQSIGHVVSLITDAITVRLLELAEEKLGPPPISYVWLAAGSQGRREQTALSDQDNCIILANVYDAREHGDYFGQLSRFVCDGLNTCGYAYCPGEMMAMTDRWRQPLSVWHRYFRGWIEEPEPMALMLSSVFFDLRPVRGDRALFEDLQGLILAKTKTNRIFQSYMASNALTHEPPIGFFRNFVLVRGGEHDHTLDLKHSGVVPIIDLARVHVLAAGAPEVNTHERLEAAGAAGMISQQGVADLADALEFIGYTRLRHQAERIRQGRPADNFISPADLSSHQRSHLKSAFRAVKTMQSVLAVRYQTGHF